MDHSGDVVGVIEPTRCDEAREQGLDVVVVGLTVEELDAAVAAIEQAAIQASCETRLLVGQQAAAFTAAALPLCRRV